MSGWRMDARRRSRGELSARQYAAEGGAPAVAVAFEEWCARRGVENALSGGYSVKPEPEPLGELWIDGGAVSHRPFADRWHARRAAPAVMNGGVEIDYRDRLPTRPSGSLLQAGPLLVRDGRSAIAGIEDPEGFAATAEAFDQDLAADASPGWRSPAPLTDCSPLPPTVVGRTTRA
jgi:hypothetical protein